ncbi:MarR family transcriptional regulator [uncultured Pigmentiphaga sp.]|uniref:MarR family winged helix-turn-helix transcriptional regulator n=1 Tax=uncultured Pigmentiphaga sp. TaxID=340361 RepID=UPI0026181772|nr:MarR family transcriptional regulator [uncultured Pigmentiphaga sp.]
MLAPKVAMLSKALMRAAVYEARGRFGLSQVEWQVVSLLHGLEPISIRELAYAAFVDAAQVSRAVSALGKRGLVERRRSLRDSREAELRLTPAGSAIAEALRATSEERNVRMLQGLAPHEVAQLYELLDLLIARARREEGRGRDEPPGAMRPDA